MSDCRIDIHGLKNNWQVQQGEEETKPNHLMNNIAKVLLDSFYFSVNGNRRQRGLFLKMFAFFKVGVTSFVSISVKTYSKSFLLSFHFLAYLRPAWVSSSNKRMLCLLIHNYQRQNLRGVFILILTGKSSIFWMEKMESVN